MSIGERLKTERQRVGMAQAAFGEIGGVQKYTQIKYEKGERFPDAQYLQRVAEHGVDVGYVITGIRSSGNAPTSEVETGLGEIDIERYERIYRALLAATKELPMDALSFVPVTVVYVYNQTRDVPHLTDAKIADEAKTAAALIKGLLAIRDDAE